MPFNLIRKPWLPMRTRSGARRWIRPAEVVCDGDPPIAPDWPRGDFNTATYELLIGLLSVACPPATHQDWRERYRNPPSVADLDAAFAPFAQAFNLDGDGPRFCQEFGGLEGEAKPIEALLIDTPGEQGLRKNADLLTHRRRYPALSKPAAAMALYALQSFAPSGGKGHMTSMRGGGPLTTLVLPASDVVERPLWAALWANVRPRLKPADSAECDKIFLWLAPAPETAKDDKLSERDPLGRIDPLHAFFGAPRRLWLRFGAPAGPCPLAGAPALAETTSVITRPHGVDYGIWRHPLTPYRRQKELAEPYSAKPKPGPFGYRDWVAAVVGDASGELRERAANMRLARSERSDALAAQGAQARIRLSGWAMNNMEAQVYLSAEQPLHQSSAPLFAAELDHMARQMANAGDLVHSYLQLSAKSALFGPGAKADSEKGALQAAQRAFFEATDQPFHRILGKAAALSEDDFLEKDIGLRRDWLKALHRAALQCFDRAAPTPLRDPEEAKPIVKARSVLVRTLQGFEKAGAKLFTELNLPIPERKGKKTQRGVMSDDPKPLSPGRICYDWWAALHPNSEGRGGDRGALARLRRTSRPFEALLEPAVTDLVAKLREHDGMQRRLKRSDGSMKYDGVVDDTLYAIGVIASTLAHVKPEPRDPGAPPPSESFAEQLGRTAAGARPRDGDRPRLSVRRFATLLDANDWEARQRQLRRAVGLLRGAPFNVVGLVDDLIIWSDAVHTCWLYAYFQNPHTAPTFDIGREEELGA